MLPGLDIEIALLAAPADLSACVLGPPPPPPPPTPPPPPPPSPDELEEDPVSEGGGRMTLPLDTPESEPPS